MDEGTGRERVRVISDPCRFYSKVRHLLGDDNISDKEIETIVKYGLVHMLQDLGNRIDNPCAPKEHYVSADSLKYMILPELYDLYREAKTYLENKDIEDLSVNVTKRFCDVLFDTTYSI